MRNSNIHLTKTEKIKFAYRLFKENTKYDDAYRILKISRRTYADWVKSFKMVGLKKTIKDIGKWKNGGVPSNKLSPSVSRLVQELRETDRYGRWKTKIILKRD